MRDLSDVFKLNPDDVIKYFDDKLPKDYDLDKLRFSAYNRTFLISGINEIETLKRMHGILKKAYQNGTSFRDCVEELKSASGLHKDHLRVVFHQNMRQVYSFARYEKQLISDKPYLRYVAIMDNRVRDSHKKFHGLILPKEHPFWRNNYPPNGWGCRCKTQVLSLDEAEALGFKENEKDKRSLLNAAVRGFDNNPIEPNNALFKVLEEKVKTAPEGLRKQARRIMNAAYTDYMKREDLYKKLKVGYDEYKPKYEAFVKQKMKQMGITNPTEEQKNDINEAFTKKISLITKKLKDREHAFIEVAKLNGASVFIDKYQMATHLKHTEITPLDYTLIDRIIKEGSIDEKESKKKGKTIMYSILGRRYKLVLKPDKGRYLVDTLYLNNEDK